VDVHDVIHTSLRPPPMFAIGNLAIARHDRR